MGENFATKFWCLRDQHPVIQPQISPLDEKILATFTRIISMRSYLECDRRFLLVINLGKTQSTLNRL